MEASPEVRQASGIKHMPATVADFSVPAVQGMQKHAATPPPLPARSGARP